MKSWMVAVIVVCNFQLVQKSKSTQIHTSTMLATLHHRRFPSPKSSLSTSCIIPPYTELSKHLIADSRVTCGVVNLSHKSGSYNSESWNRFRVGSLVRYARALRWTPIPLGLGFAYIAYQQLRHIRKRESSKLSSGSPSDLIASDLQVSLYTMLPLRATSRFWGWMNTLDLPNVVRKPVLSMFINTFGCDVHEAMVEDLDHYHNLGEFFRRSLKPEVRPIHPGNDLVSPCDGTILHFGTIENGLIEQVKGISYSLKSFLGPSTNSSISDKEYHHHLIRNEENVLYHCVVYLAPGDYHKFHSPTKWTVRHRRHFPGQLLSVRPGIVNWIAGLFNLNERVVYHGEWLHGFFSLTAVGATNVGSIRVYFDENLETNQKKYCEGLCDEKSFVSQQLSGVTVTKGSPFGEFNLGSTVVLVFEAPKHMKFSVKHGQKIKYGQLLSQCNQEGCDAA